MRVQPQKQKRNRQLQVYLIIALLLFLLLFLVVGTTFVIMSSIGFIRVPWSNNLSTIFITIFIPVIGAMIPLLQSLHSFFSHKDESSQASHSPQSLSGPENLFLSHSAQHQTQTISSGSTTGHTTTQSATMPLRENIDKEPPSNYYCSHIDWGEAPNVSQFYGRVKERDVIEQWIVHDHCRLVIVLGIGGVGKTALTVKLVEHVKDTFTHVFWRSLQNAPPLEHILRDCIHFVSSQRQIDLPKDVKDQIALLMKYLREQRCFLVLDNVESILQQGNRAGQYLDGYEQYGKLFQRIGESLHKSALLLTSREKPQEIAHLEGNTAPTRSLLLSGVGQVEGQEILKDKGLVGSSEAWTKLINCYSGNPLALKIVSEPIQALFEGDIATFLQAGEIVFGDIHNLLDQQFNRLSPFEQELLYWLAVEREAISLKDLQKNLVHSLSTRTQLDALDSLRRRSMIEISGPAYFTLQPAIMEYITTKFIEQICNEIESEAVKIFESHALIKALAADYVRESQTRIILAPIANRLKYMAGLPARHRFTSCKFFICQFCRMPLY